MNKTQRHIVLAATLIGAVGAQNALAQTRTGPYLGFTPPGMTPEVFAPGIVSTDKEEVNAVFSPDGKELVFSRATATGEDPNFDLFLMRDGPDGWSAAPPFAGNGPSFDLDVSYSVDGNRLYWAGKHPVDGKLPESMQLYYSDRQADGWTKAKLGPAVINAFNTVLYPVEVTDGSLYFASRGGESKGGLDVFRSPLVNGEHQAPVNIGAPVNTENSEADTFVAPDESYLIVSSRRDGGQGASDLYISIKQADGSWGELQNLGSRINSTDSEYCPRVSSDGKYLFFTSRRSGNSDIYWVSADVLKKFM